MALVVDCFCLQSLVTLLYLFSIEGKRQLKEGREVSVRDMREEAWHEYEVHSRNKHFFFTVAVMSCLPYVMTIHVECFWFLV